MKKKCATTYLFPNDYTKIVDENAQEFAFSFAQFFDVTSWLVRGEGSNIVVNAKFISLFSFRSGIITTKKGCCQIRKKIIKT